MCPCAPALRLAIAGLGEKIRTPMMRPRANSAPGGGGLCGVRPLPPPSATSSPPGQLLVGLSLSLLCGADVLQMRLWGGEGAVVGS
jgi:hypothetical protein